MVLSHNQMAYVAIVVTMIFGSLFVGVSGIMDTTVRYEDAGGDVLDDQDVTQTIQDSDGDGLSDQIEKTQYGTDPAVWDTDRDGLSDGWEVLNGLDPNDPGDAGVDDNTIQESVDSDCTDEEISFESQETDEQKTALVDGVELTYNVTYLTYTLPNGITKTIEEPEPWVPKNGIYELDDGKFIVTASTILYCGGTALPDDGGSPENGPTGDPDKDGLTNAEEAELGTNPNLRDTDADGLGDKWEADHRITKEVPGASGVTVDLFNPLDGNWGCELLTESREGEVDELLSETGPLYEFADEFGRDFNDRYSCDSVLDVDLDGPDGLINFLEEKLGTNPLDSDSDNDLLSDSDETKYGVVSWTRWCGKSSEVKDRAAPFTHISDNNLDWFLEDMDGDGKLNGPSDWDTDGDGMPDGFEHCFASALDHPSDPETTNLLDPADGSDAYYDWDSDELSNYEEYETALLLGDENFTNPWLVDTDGDEMPDGWEKENGLHPAWAGDKNLDPDFDGWDQDGDGSVVYSDLVYTTTVTEIGVELGQQVSKNEEVARGLYTLPGGVPGTAKIYSPVDGYVYQILVTTGDPNDVDKPASVIESRQDVWMVIVETHERFTNIDEYNAKFMDGDGEVDTRSTKPNDWDTDGDLLADGIEVLGWYIEVVIASEKDGTKERLVTSDPGLQDTDKDGLDDFGEFNYISNGCKSGTNASNSDTDGDGLDDYFEAINGHPDIFGGGTYFTSPCMFDTDNDQLRDGEEVSLGDDGFVTNASDRDTDNDGLKDGAETLYTPRPFHGELEYTDPLNNDTDGDGMLDGWEMQVYSAEENTNSHSLWISKDIWEDPQCTVGINEPPNKCSRDPGAYLWANFDAKSGDEKTGFPSSPTYELWEINITNFNVPENDLCDCRGRWALNPMFGSLPDSLYDVDNDTLMNSVEGPDRWDTNPVVKDTDEDGLPDGWEVEYSLQAMELGLADNATLGSFGARGVLDPALDDSNNNGIKDGDEDLDDDGLNRTSLLNKYCPGWDNSQNSECHIDPNQVSGNYPGKKFYDDLENYTNYEEYVNGTNPILNDTDGDGWEDGPEVFYQDHDDDGMATGWEYHFDYNPFNEADKNGDEDFDGHRNWCEFKWNTNPRDSLSFPGQGQLC